MDALFNMQKIRFSTLDRIFSTNNENIYTDSRVNVFINLEPIFRKLIVSKVDDYFKVQNREKDYEMIANIFNIAAHYRLYFNRAKIESRIFMYFGHPFKSEYRNKELIPDYRTFYENRFTNDARGKYVGYAINNIVDPLKTILNYVEGVYLITTNYIEPSLIPRIISEDFNSRDVGLLITTDKYEYQYVNYGFGIIRNKRDESYYINKSNVMEIIKREAKVTSKVTAPTGYLPFILSFQEDKVKNIPNIKGVGPVSLLTAIEKGIGSNHLSKDKFNFSMMEPMLKKELIDDIRINFLCTDIESQYQLCTESSILPIKEQIVDLFDEHSIKKINEEYFNKNPMMIMEIQPYTNKPKKNVFGL